MVGILDSFTVRLKKLDETIIPVYQQTKRLTTLQESILMDMCVCVCVRVWVWVCSLTGGRCR